MRYSSVKRAEAVSLVDELYNCEGNWANSRCENLLNADSLARNKDQVSKLGLSTKHSIVELRFQIGLGYWYAIVKTQRSRGESTETVQGSKRIAIYTAGINQ